MSGKTDKAEGKFIDDVRDGSVHFGIWRDEGTKGPYYKAKLEHSYFKDGEFHPTDFYGMYELIDLARAALQTANKMRKQMRQESGKADDEQEAVA